MPSACIQRQITGIHEINASQTTCGTVPVITFTAQSTQDASMATQNTVNTSFTSHDGSAVTNDVLLSTVCSSANTMLSSSGIHRIPDDHRTSSEMMCHLVDGDDTTDEPGSPPLSPGPLSPRSTAEPPQAETQMSLIERSDALNLSDPLGTVDANTLWSMVTEDAMDEVQGGGARKSRKTSVLSDARTSSHFVFTKFGSDVPGLSFPAEPSLPDSTDEDQNIRARTETVMLKTEDSPTGLSMIPDSTCQQQLNLLVTTTLTDPKQILTTESAKLQQASGRAGSKRILKEPSLNVTFPAKAAGCELKILVQPEDQHRARYMTEGSRGAIKDKTQQGHPVVKLLGYNEPVALQVFIGNDTGKVKPHGFYQACKVCGKNSSQCAERDIEGTTVIEIMLDPKDDMTASIDCVGILKLRNADVEQRIGVARSKKKKVPTATLR